jgi:hypothetical protein
MAEFVLGYGIVTTHGNGAAALHAALRGGVSKPTEIPQNNWPVTPNGRALAFFANREAGIPVRELLAARLFTAWQEACGYLEPAELSGLRGDCSVIFASTKGCVEDYIWTGAEGDPYSPVVETFLARAELRPRRWLTVSAACASSHAALHLAREWLQRGETKHVIVLAADYVGPFVLQGFHSLRALSPTTIQPFAGARDGLLLGEAAGCVIVGKEGSLRFGGSGLDAEGHAVTRPAEEAASLRRVVELALEGNMPDGVIAHGTATVANDRAEDLCFTECLPARPPVTATKWSVGHTLGASGLVDLVAAAGWFAAREPFRIATCAAADPAFRSRILTADAKLDPRGWKRLLVTALGFGGVHAAFTVEDTCS